MDKTTWLETFCRMRHAWPHEDAQLPYVAIAEVGHQLVDDLLKERDPTDCRRAFDYIERGLAEGDGETRNLIIVGLFEGMQGDMYYQRDHPDRLDDWFGPLSEKAWRDLIEGWTGDGIRTIEHWQRVLTNGEYGWVEWTCGETTVRWRREQVSAEPGWLMTRDAQIGEVFRPLVARTFCDVLNPDEAGCIGRRLLKVGTHQEPVLSVGPRREDGSLHVVQVSGMSQASPKQERIALIAPDDSIAVWPPEMPTG